MNFKLCVLIVLILKFNNLNAKCMFKSSIDGYKLEIMQYDPIKLKGIKLSYLSNACPNLAKKSNFICGDPLMVSQFENYLQFLSMNLNSTDPRKKCYGNIFQLLCSIITIDQSEYFDIAEITESDQKMYVKRLIAKFDSEDKEIIFNSCKLDDIHSTLKKIVQNSHNSFDFFNNLFNDWLPFKIDFNHLQSYIRLKPLYFIFN